LRSRSKLQLPFSYFLLALRQWERRNHKSIARPLGGPGWGPGGPRESPRGGFGPLLAAIGRYWPDLGSLLARSWLALGLLLACSWTALDRSWPLLGRSWLPNMLNLPPLGRLQAIKINCTACTHTCTQAQIALELRLPRFQRHACGMCVHSRVCTRTHSHTCLKNLKLSQALPWGPGRHVQRDRS